MTTCDGANVAQKLGGERVRIVEYLMNETHSAAAHPQRYCLSCSYPLDGLDKPRCPECGRGFRADDSTTYATAETQKGTPSRWIAIAAWVTAIYPALGLASLYTTWMTAWFVLGHRPRPSLDDPLSISPIVDIPYAVASIFLNGSLFAAAISLPFLVAAMLELFKARCSMRAVVLLGPPLFIWVASVILVPLDLYFGSVLYWYLD